MTRALLARKATHTLLALVAAYTGLYYTLEHVLLLCLCLGVAFVAGYGVRALDPVRRAEVKSIGEIFFVIGIACAALLCLPAAPTAFVGGVLVLGLADTSASIIGRLWGGRAYHIFGETRTYGGSLTVLVVSAVILVVLGMHPLFALCAGWLLAAVEAIAPRGSDNVVLPVVAALLLLLVV